MGRIIASFEGVFPLAAGGLTGEAGRWVATGLGIATLVCLAIRKPRLRGTTLVAVWWWTLVALVGVAGVEMIAPWTFDWGASKLPALRFLAAMGTFCPLMALLGAKRPQDRGWQFIVLSLWVVLSLPGFEWLLWGEVRQLGPARCAFVATLIAIGAINGLMTRGWPASVLTAVGQSLLVAPFFFVGEHWLAGPLAPLAGLAALVAAELARLLPLPGNSRALVTPHDRVWLDFRDAFGLVWGLRIAERMNTSAAMYDWPVKLAWHGFEKRPTEGTANEIDHDKLLTVPGPIEDNLRTLLRRFVSVAWIDRRLGPREAAEPDTSTFASDSSRISAG